ncbi:damage-control phosphatase ARMT1 family protein [Streptomyces polygonati]|uniref:Damage-control phosphatase ARMT1 family protein n=1 Tax=Streptomyces polygonati TaxID=1617087 RepID=A0ABV8I024_9ACTN
MPEADTAPSSGAPVIIGGAPGSFARKVLTERHPALIQQVRDAIPYGPPESQALHVLREEIEGGAISPLPVGAHGYEQWNRWGREYIGRSWFEVPFLWAESYFYRRLLEAVGYFEAGPWQGIDPFGPAKRAELRSRAVEEELAALDDVAGLPPEARDLAVLHGALWGNRADLGFRISSGRAAGADGGSEGDGEGGGEGTGRVIVDDSAVLWEYALPPGAVHVLADNAGRELTADLVLIDHLLHTGRAATVVLHVKPYPYFVSDATTADVVHCLRRMTRAPGHAAGVGARLWEAMNSGCLAVHTHAFACAPLPYAAMPGDLRDDLARATLVIAKGDLNYRRLVGDQHWPGTTSFAELTSYFPGDGPLIALRTLKSEVAVGLDAAALDALDASGEPWRTNGTHAVIQARRP